MNIKPIRNQVLDFIPAIFPGIDRLVLLYQSANDDKLTEGFEILKNGNSYRNRTLSMNANINQLLPSSNEQNFKWIHNSELPFEPSNNSYSPTLFSENEYLVLNIVVTDVKSGGVELYYLFFRDDLSNFGINTTGKLLDTQQKFVVGTFLYKFIDYLYATYAVNSTKLEDFTNVTKRVIQDVSNKSNLENNWFKSWVIDVLKDLPNQPIGNWTLDSEALDKLKSIKDYSECKKIILEAGRFSSMLYSSDENWPIMESFILPSSIKLDNTTNVTPNVDDTERPLSRMERVYLWLDSVEEAAQSLVNDGEEATGAAVGALLNPPVSAPAITDWLRKNQSRVSLALERNNEKWPIIRSYFRPLINAINREMVEKTG